MWSNRDTNTDIAIIVAMFIVGLIIIFGCIAMFCLLWSTWFGRIVLIVSMLLILFILSRHE